MNGDGDPLPLDQRAFPPVRKHKIPRWLLNSVKQLTGKKHWELAPYIENTGKTAGWLDHHGTAMLDGREIFVSQPYHLHPETKASLARFCDLFDLNFEVQQGGPYGFRIIISPKDEY